MLPRMSRSLMIVDGFAPEAARLRAHFDARLLDPRKADPGRFVWDFWHVPGQYTLLRTPAWKFFPRRLYEAFHRRLVLWGRRTLGCHDISPPWLSCYVEGCRQELHGDLPHGPWAFVFSLTPWERRAFRGGETLLAREEVLDLWRDFVSERAVEEDEILEAVPARMNRLVVFDPRIPHGVRRVEGTLDPREGRLVVHGWFVQPRPFVEGPLALDALQAGIDLVSEHAAPLVGPDLPVAGMISLAFPVAADGSVGAVKVLSDTTRVPGELERERRAFVRTLARTVKALRFPRQRGASLVTLPLVFERGGG